MQGRVGESKPVQGRVGEEPENTAQVKTTGGSHCVQRNGVHGKDQHNA